MTKFEISIESDIMKNWKNNKDIFKEIHSIVKDGIDKFDEQTLPSDDPSLDKLNESIFLFSLTLFHVLLYFDLNTLKTLLKNKDLIKNYLHKELDLSLLVNLITGLLNAALQNKDRKLSDFKSESFASILELGRWFRSEYKKDEVKTTILPKKEKAKKLLIERIKHVRDMIKIDGKITSLTKISEKYNEIYEPINYNTLRDKLDYLGIPKKMKDFTDLYG